LDYYRDRAPREHQINIYKEQLALASIMNLPVIIHCREAMQDILDISFGWLDGLQKNGHPLARNPGVFHAFDGDLATAVRICERGFFIGIGGPVTYRNAQNRHDLATVIPLENMVLETDAPFLAPQPHRGERNEPSYLKHIAVMVAGLRKIDCQKISQMTGQNAERLLGWRAGI
jgi:TatD DNase family protein